MRTTSPIAALFGKSPFRPLQEHMRVAAECAEHLVPLFEALLAGDRDRLRDERGRIFELEREADQLKNDLRSHLPRGLFMPVDRRDLLHLLGAQDSIADGAQDIASLLTVHEIQVPECLRGELLPFTHSVLETVRVAKQAVSEIDELVESGFRGGELEAVGAIIARISDLETATDETGLRLVGELFRHEDEIRPLHVIYWQKVIRQLGRIADHAENVGDRLRLMIAR